MDAILQEFAKHYAKYALDEIQRQIESHESKIYELKQIRKHFEDEKKLNDLQLQFMNKFQTTVVKVQNPKRLPVKKESHEN